jgi:beta-1,2-mannobiose phosphorylase / 1,2-beta-oligomannan phosphorylase
MEIFTRFENNPILKPNPNNFWENFKVYNPGAIFDGTIFHLFYRALGKGENGQSVIGHAISSDGENFERLEKPALIPTEPEEGKGLEDPRVTKVGDIYYMAYGACWGDGNKRDVRLDIATSVNLVDWQKRGHAFSDFNFLKNGGSRVNCEDGKLVNYNHWQEGKERSKSGAIFPEKINGKFWMLFGEFNIWLASSDDGLKWQVEPGVFLSPRVGKFFDQAFVEMGPVPVKTEKGWLVLYHGIDNWKTYRLGLLLLDLNDLSKIIYRHDEAIFSPRADYELSGFVDVLPGGLEKMQKMTDTELNEYIAESVKNKKMPLVVFCPGAIVLGDEILIYYGASDSVVCGAKGKISDILALIP